MNSPKVKIFISYKDEHKLFKNEIITPIQTGRAIATKSFEGMLGDDTGDNVSKENPRYNELSAQYWVWKHYEEIGNPDYVGFMHYRRHFVFDENFSLQNKASWFPGMPIYKIAAQDASCEKNLYPEAILATLKEQADCYVIKPYDIRQFAPGDLYMKHHFLNYVPGSRRDVWNQFVQVVCDVTPDYVPYLRQFMYGHTLHACNMFIMKKDLFFEYSSFCFRVLKELDKRVDSSSFKGQEERFLGFLGEYLLTIFVMKLQQESSRKISYLDALFLTEKNSSFTKKLSDYFAIINTSTHKVLVLFGKQIKLKRHNRARLLVKRLEMQEKQLAVLESKITDLEEELFFKELKKR
ncbi:MAG: DUF4422 domain-containing protein [Elusimicrobiaceae bacterium]|nr:DUF4422 domain-containing protein [Elusimicrobiaceae bacterium]